MWSPFPNDPTGVIGFGLWNEVFNPNNPNSIAGKQKSAREAQEQSYQTQNSDSEEEYEYDTTECNNNNSSDDDWIDWE